MAAGASALDSKYGGKYGCNLTKFGGQVNGNQGGTSGWGKATSLLSGTTYDVTVLDDEDYAIEERKGAYEDDPSILAVPTDHKRKKETERQAFREEMKKMRKELVSKAEDKREKKLELNPLLKVKSKDGSVSLDGISAAALNGSSEADATATTAKTPLEAGTLTGEAGVSVVAAAEELLGSPLESPTVYSGRASLTGTATGSAPASAGAATSSTPAPAAIGGLLGYDSDDDSSDAEDNEDISNGNYLNLHTQASRPPSAIATAAVSAPAADAASEDTAAVDTAAEVVPQRRFPLPRNPRPASNASSAIAAKVAQMAAPAPVQVTAPAAAALPTVNRAEATPLRRFPLPKFRTQAASPASLQEFCEERKEPAETKAQVEMEDPFAMKEVSPALAALMAGLDA